jgi:hypothetical protein
MSAWRPLVLLLFMVPVVLGHAQSSDDKRGSKTWVGRNQEVEEYLKTAQCVTVKWFTHTVSGQCTLRPGGPIAKLALKARTPGVYRGFRESYKNEIAAYELDKLLKLDMVPPTVERRIDGTDGAAQQWVENVVDGTNPALPGNENRQHWESEQVRMTMFDNLIGNRDRNRANMLRDSTWNLILIDHMRAFGTETDLFQKMGTIDDAYWARIERVTRKQLDDALAMSLESSQIEAILARRERMRADIKSRPK